MRTTRLGGSAAWCFAWVLLALPAEAQRLAVGPITGPGAANLTKQLSQTLCDTAECVPASDVTTSGKPDWKKAKKAGVSVFLTGTVVKKGRVHTVTLEVWTGPGKPKATKAWPGEDESFSPKHLSEVAALMSQYVKRGAPPPVVESDESEPPKVTKTDKSGKGKKGDDDRPLRLSGETPKEPAAEEETPPKEREPEGEGDLNATRFAAWVGFAVLNRHYDYSGAASGNLRRYDLPIFPSPRLGVEAFPFAQKPGLLAGLGFEGALDCQGWLKSRKLNDPTEFPTSAVKADVSARWRFPVASFFVTPRVGVRYQAFTVSAASTGAKLDGLPNLAYFGPRLGADLEGKLLDDTLRLWGGGSVIPELSSGDVLSPAFFNKGSNVGFELHAGVAVHVYGPAWLVATGEFSLNVLSFQAQPTDPYVAAGATDRYLGAGVAVRVEL
jgi:hypothetical protein